MSDEPDRPKKSIQEHVEDLWKDVLDIVDSLVNPEPELVPIPVRNRPAHGRRPGRR